MKREDCGRGPKRTLVVGFLASLSRSTLFIQHVDQGVGGLPSSRCRGQGILTSEGRRGWGWGNSGATCTLRSSWKLRVRRTGFPPGPQPLAPSALCTAFCSSHVSCGVGVAVFLQEIKQLHSPGSQPGTCLKFLQHFQMPSRKEDRLVVDQKTSISLCLKEWKLGLQEGFVQPGPTC